MKKHGKLLILFTISLVMCAITANADSVGVTNEGILKIIKVEHSKKSGEYELNLSKPYNKRKDYKNIVGIYLKTKDEDRNDQSGRDKITFSDDGAHLPVEMYLGAGNDYVYMYPENSDYKSTGSDHIDVGKGDDVVFSGGGNDYIFGGVGADLIFGGTGHDTILGDDGEDELYGGNGNDEVKGGCGDDTIFGGNGNDTIYGGKDDDTIYGGNGNDTIYGGSGNSFIYGNDGNDVIYGGEKADQSGRDVIKGADGNDFISVLSNNDSGVDDIIGGGKGNDFISVQYDIGGNTRVEIESGEGLDSIQLEYVRPEFVQPEYSPTKDFLVVASMTTDFATNFLWTTPYLKTAATMGSFKSAVQGALEIYSNNVKDKKKDYYAEQMGRWDEYSYISVTDFNPITDKLIIPSYETLRDEEATWDAVPSLEDNVVNIDFKVGDYLIAKLVVGDEFINMVKNNLNDLGGYNGDIKFENIISDSYSVFQLNNTEFGDSLSKDNNKNENLAYIYGNTLNSNGSGVKSTACATQNFPFIVGSESDEVISLAGAVNIEYGLGFGGDDLFQTWYGVEALRFYHGGSGNDTISFSELDYNPASVEYSEIDDYEYCVVADLSGNFDDTNTIYEFETEAIIEDVRTIGDEAREGEHTATNKIYFHDIENLIGGKNSDWLKGSNEDNLINGMEGDDYLEGLNGNDTLWAGYGNDTILCGNGDDTAYTGPGNNNVIYGNPEKGIEADTDTVIVQKEAMERYNYKNSYTFVRYFDRNDKLYVEKVDGYNYRLKINRRKVDGTTLYLWNYTVEVRDSNYTMLHVIKVNQDIDRGSEPNYGYNKVKTSETAISTMLRNNINEDPVYETRTYNVYQFD